MYDQQEIKLVSVWRSGVAMLLLCFCITILLPLSVSAAIACPSGTEMVGTRSDGTVCKRTSDGQLMVAVDPAQYPGCPSGTSPVYMGQGRATPANFISNGQCVDSTANTAHDTNGSVSKPKTNVSISCSGWWDNATSPACWWRMALAGIGSALMWIGIKAVTLAGAAFEFVLKYLIVEFGSTLSALKDGINVGWTALRDIANIIIIGLFVFIAINIILGVKDFGDKKKVAHVLIVAVLINFSLLFTKVIVDASNFTAFQFYKSMVSRFDAGGSQTFGAVSVASGNANPDSQSKLESKGVAAKFMNLLGVEGVVSSWDQIRNVQESQNDGLIGLGYGVISFIFLIAVAFVLLYGTFLILSRAVLIIFLMLTSAIAFATWLIPQQYVEKGFSKWWESLLKAAFFAPILMSLLWITVIVSDELVTNGQSITGLKRGTLGALASSASSQENMLAVFYFIVILGLLFAAFATASAFSKTISGFRFAQAGVGGAIFTSLGGASRLLGLAGRGSIGALSASTFRWMRDNRLASGPDSTLGTRMTARTMRWLGQRTFDPMAVKTARSFSQKLGGMVFGGDEIGKGGFIGVKQRQAKAAEELARAMRPSEASRNALSEAARANEQATIDAQHRALDQSAAPHIGAARGAAREGAEEENRVRDTQQAERDNIRNVARPAAQATVEAVRQQLATEQDRQRAMEESYRNEIRSTQQQRIAAAQKAARVAELEEERSSARAGFERIISQRTQDLQTHEAAVQQLDQRVQQLDRQASRAGEEVARSTQEYAEAHLENIERDRRALRGDTAGRLQRAGQQATAPYEVRALAEQIVNSKVTPFRQAIRAELGGAIEQHNLEQAVAAFARAQRAAQGPTPPPAPPPANP